MAKRILTVRELNYLAGFKHAASAAQAVLDAGDFLPVAYATRYPRVSVAALCGVAQGSAPEATGHGGWSSMPGWSEGVRDGIASGFGF